MANATIVEQNVADVEGGEFVLAERGPNSTPAREPSAAASSEEVGWPLDLNRRLDRESVDKSVSFHD